ncbi:hypothetical protein PHYPSEUDO_002519 [Phytophthora pseudosyringae]|uniref:Uncharacterized protein n=1 Tax=Phytophthora pseudosyringae TaxID=221518 RepID=A0A8T1VTL6_9STRA|nr:hypothetical protein PHYPSEUDO_002519 [Phytophthora pseudosyringae]
MEAFALSNAALGITAPASAAPVAGTGTHAATIESAAATAVSHGARKLRLSAVATMAALAHTLTNTARTAARAVCPFICVGLSRLSGCDKIVPDWEHLVLVFQL